MPSARFYQAPAGGGGSSISTPLGLPSSFTHTKRDVKEKRMAKQFTIPIAYLSGKKAPVREETRVTYPASQPGKRFTTLRYTQLYTAVSTGAQELTKGRESGGSSADAALSNGTEPRVITGQSESTVGVSAVFDCSHAETFYFLRWRSGVIILGGGGGQTLDSDIIEEQRIICDRFAYFGRFS